MRFEKLSLQKQVAKKGIDIKAGFFDRAGNSFAVAKQLRARPVIYLYGLGLNPAVIVLFCSCENHFATISSAWRFKKQIVSRVIHYLY